MHEVPPSFLLRRATCRRRGSICPSGIDQMLRVDLSLRGPASISVSGTCSLVYCLPALPDGVLWCSCLVHVPWAWRVVPVREVALLPQPAGGKVRQVSGSGFPLEPAHGCLPVVDPPRRCNLDMEHAPTTSNRCRHPQHQARPDHTRPDAANTTRPLSDPPTSIKGASPYGLCAAACLVRWRPCPRPM